MLKHWYAHQSRNIEAAMIDDYAWNTKPFQPNATLHFCRFNICIGSSASWDISKGVSISYPVVFASKNNEVTLKGTVVPYVLFYTKYFLMSTQLITDAVWQWCYKWGRSKCWHCNECLHHHRPDSATWNKVQPFHVGRTEPDVDNISCYPRLSIAIFSVLPVS